MYNANEMNAIAIAARNREKTRRKCIAQNFFADVYPAIEKSASKGFFSCTFAIPGDTRVATKEIVAIFRNFGYGVKLSEGKFFSTMIEVKW